MNYKEIQNNLKLNYLNTIDNNNICFCLYKKLSLNVLDLISQYSDKTIYIYSDDVNFYKKQLSNFKNIKYINDILYNNLDKAIYFCSILNFKNINNTHIENFIEKIHNIFLNINNYAVFTSLYDNNKLIDSNNLYYFKGILKDLCCLNRDYDIYIDITEDCYDTLIKIILQEDLNTDNIFFNIKKNKEALNSNGMSWRFITALNHIDKYDCITITDSDLEFEKYFHVLNNINQAICMECDYNMELVPTWGCYQHFPGGCTYFKYKNIISDIGKIRYIYNSIVNNSKIIKKYEFDEFLLTNIFYKDLLNNNYGYFYISENDFDTEENYLTKYSNVKIIDNYKKKQYRELFYYNNDTYYLNDKKYLYDKLKPVKTIETEDYFNDIKTCTINKYLYLQIRRYMLGYIDNLNIENIFYE